MTRRNPLNGTRIFGILITLFRRGNHHDGNIGLAINLGEKNCDPINSRVVSFTTDIYCGVEHEFDFSVVMLCKDNVMLVVTYQHMQSIRSIVKNIIFDMQLMCVILNYASDEMNKHIIDGRNLVIGTIKMRSNI